MKLYAQELLAVGAQIEKGEMLERKHNLRTYPARIILRGEQFHVILLVVKNAYDIIIEMEAESDEERMEQEARLTTLLETCVKENIGDVQNIRKKRNFKLFHWYSFMGACHIALAIMLAELFVRKTWYEVIMLFFWGIMYALAYSKKINCMAMDCEKKCKCRVEYIFDEDDDMYLDWVEMEEKKKEWDEKLAAYDIEPIHIEYDRKYMADVFTGLGLGSVVMMILIIILNPHFACFFVLFVTIAYVIFTQYFRDKNFHIQEW